MREVRMGVPLSLRDVVAISKVFSKKHKNRRFIVTVSMLSSIESDKRTPNIYAIGALAKIYRLDLSDILSWYGVK